MNANYTYECCYLPTKKKIILFFFYYCAISFFILIFYVRIYLFCRDTLRFLFQKNRCFFYSSKRFKYKVFFGIKNDSIEYLLFFISYRKIMRRCLILLQFRFLWWFHTAEIQTFHLFSNSSCRERKWYFPKRNMEKM